MPEAAAGQAALGLAIQMETKGKEFYREAVKNCGNAPGKKLFRSLAREEDAHRRDFLKIYESLRQQYAWPETATAVKKTPRRPPYLTGLTRETCELTHPAPSERDAVMTAIAMENESYDFYRQQLAKAAYPGEKKFYEAVSAAENAHRLALVDYLEFLTDPAGYFVAKEHPVLD